MNHREAWVIEHTPVLRAGFGKVYNRKKRMRRNMALLRGQSLRQIEPRVWLECPNGCHNKQPWLVKDLMTNPKKDISPPNTAPMHPETKPRNPDP